MGDGVGLIADEIVEAVGGVCVDETVADPLSSADAGEILVLGLGG